MLAYISANIDCKSGEELRIKDGKVTVKKSSPTTGLDRPTGFQEVEAPRFLDNRHMKVVRLSALRTGRVYPPEAELTIVRPMKKSTDTIGNRNRDLPLCSAVPQPTAPPPPPMLFM
jgi:hypothetical protein